MPCQDCYHNKQITGDMVACGSMKHARFMDLFDSKRYQEQVSVLGAMPLLSTEAIKLECPDHETPKEYWERKSKKGGKR